MNFEDQAITLLVFRAAKIMQDGMTALMFAVKKGSESVVNQLLAKKPNVHAVTKVNSLQLQTPYALSVKNLEF